MLSAQREFQVDRAESCLGRTRESPSTPSTSSGGAAFTLTRECPVYKDYLLRTSSELELLLKDNVGGHKEKDELRSKKGTHKSETKKNQDVSL
jgi:hypothetical protein